MLQLWSTLLLVSAFAADPPVPSARSELAVESFSSTIAPLDAAHRARMAQVAMHEGCPVGFDALALLQVSYWNDDGAIAQGELVVAQEHAASLRAVFARLFALRFPIHSVRLIDDFGGSDDASMAANNTSAFNCRPIAGGTSWSRHSYGAASDLNPLVNPYVKGARVLPPAGAPYVDRAAQAPGLIRADDDVVKAFGAQGWKWGGAWTSLQDYQHFSVSGR